MEQAHKLSFKIFEYSESLVTINGMKPMEVVNPSENKDDDDDEDLAVFFNRQMQLIGGNRLMEF